MKLHQGFSFVFHGVYIGVKWFNILTNNFVTKSCYLVLPPHTIPPCDSSVAFAFIPVHILNKTGDTSSYQCISTIGEVFILLQETMLSKQIFARSLTFVLR